MILSAHSLRGNHGLSVFGHAGPALLPFVVGLTSVAAVTAHAARRLPGASRRARMVKGALYVFALCIVGIVVTPDDVATWVYGLHIAASAALLAAGLVAMASQFEWISHLFAGEVAFQTIFLILLIRVVADPTFTGAG